MIGVGRTCAYAYATVSSPCAASRLAYSLKSSARSSLSAFSGAAARMIVT